MLTGHKFVAKDHEGGNYESTLSKNVTFFRNDPIGLLMQLSGSRRYNNPTSEFNDIMIVSIPKEELERNEKNIIIEKNKDRYLNPAYIRGFARIGVENGNIEDFIDNSKFIDKEEKQETPKTMNTEEWKKQFEGWYEKSSTTKMQRIKANIVNLFSRMLNKEKNKEIGDGQGR